MSDLDSMIDRANAAAFGNAASVRRSAYALSYHIAAPSGWVNDPNGLVRFGGRYHVFYQHYPYAPVWGPMHWGHASSTDLVHWRHEPVALAPDAPYEEGCFSGSAVDDNGILTLIYTAHADKLPVKETQCIARSHDGGKTFVKSPLNPVIPHYPEECSPDFRDPKVWRQDGKWHMVVGTRHGQNGCVALYSSDDLEHWDDRGILCESDGTLGDMWECPNFCRVDGQDILIVSPMNMPGHKNVAMFGTLNLDEAGMTLGAWQDLDLGDDFYAAQVMTDGDRTLLIGWMDMWGREHPTEADGWAGALTLPRELHFKDGKLIQIPAPELIGLRGEKSDEASGDAMEILIDRMEGTLILRDAEDTLMSVTMMPGKVTFTVGEKVVSSPISGENVLRVFIDRCSVECFAANGEVCFTERLYPKGGSFHAALEGKGRMECWKLNPAFE